MVEVLRKGEVLTAATVVSATPEQVYAVVSDVTRIPQWSPETVEVEWLESGRRFRGRNRRRLGRWSTESQVVSAVPDREFSFVVELMGGDWTQWTYRVEPGTEPGTTRLVEEFRLCTELPRGVRAFELVALFVRDRRTDLQRNLEHSVEQVRRVVEAEQRVT